MRDAIFATPKAKSKRRREPTRAPVTEVQSGGGYDIRRADRFKRTPTYSRAAAVATRARRQQLAARYTHRAPARTTIAPVHAPLLARVSGALLHAVTHPQPIGTTAIRGGKGKGHRVPGATAQPGLLVGTPAQSIPARAIRGVAIATKEDPKGVASKTVTGGAQLLVGIPAGLGELAYGTTKPIVTGHPLHAIDPYKRLAKGTVADVKRRYGPLAKGNDRAFINRIKKEGAAPELADLSLAAAGVGATAGKALVETARAGGLGEQAARFAGEARPRLRYSGGTGVREQHLANRVTRIAAQRLQDKLRAGRATRVDSEGRVVGLQPQFTPTEKAIQRENRRRAARGQAPLAAKVQGEVTPLLARSTAREQRIAASRASARSYIGTRHEQTAEISKGTEKELAALSPRQRRAVFHVTQGIVPLDAGVDAVREALDERKAQIVAAQKKAGVTEPRVLRRHTELRAIEFLHKHADEIFSDSRLADFHAANLQRQARLTAEDPGLRALTAETRRYRPQGEFLGVKYDPGARTDADLEAYQRDYIGRVREKATARGLPEPAYFKHAKRLLPRLSLRTGGNVSRAIGGVKQSDMKLLREGRAVTNPDVLVQGLAENIKRKHQWNAVADVLDEHAFSWSRGKRGGSSISHLQDEIDRRGLRHEDLSFLDLGVMRGARAAASGSDDALHTALTNGIVTGVHARKLAQAGDSIVKTRGFVAIPKAVGDELLANTRPPSRGARLAGKFQGLQSAAILGLNPSFLQVQVAANTLQAGAAMRGNFADFARSMPWYRHLNPGQRKVVDEALGVGVFEGHSQVAHLGSTAGPVARALERIGQVPVVRTPKGTLRITDLNPTQAMFRSDDFQTKAFRRAVFYNDLKRQAFSKLTTDLGRSQAALKTLADRAKVGSGESANHAVARLLEDPAAVERAARATDDALGDYLRYTARERRLLKPTIIFYGFFRYALRTLFHTLPVKHPLLGSIGLKLGQLHNEELRAIFGTRDVPTYALSRGAVYDNQGRPVRTKEGTPKTIDFARINPLTTPVTDVIAEGPQAAAGAVSPLAQAIVNLVARKNVTLNKPLTLHGSGAEAKHVGPVDAGRVAAAGVLGSLFPYRVAMAARTHGRTQSDDALLFSERPVTYKTADAQQREAERIKARGDFRAALEQQLLPLAIPKVDRTAQSLRAKSGGTDDLAGLPPAERRALLREAAHVARQQASPAARAQAVAEQREAAYLLRQAQRSR